MLSTPDTSCLSGLDFPQLDYGGRETPLDLNVLLFFGGAKAHTRRVAGMIEAGALGEIRLERIPLVRRIHEIILDKLISGGSHSAVQNSCRTLRTFFTWAEKSNSNLNLDSVQSVYLSWTDSLHKRVGGHCPLNEKMTRSSAYTQGAVVGQILDEVLERVTPIVGFSRLLAPFSRKSVISPAVDKQIIRDTMEFGHMLQDICDCLTVDTVLKAPQPVVVHLRSGKTIVEQTFSYRTALREQKKRLVKWAAGGMPEEFLKINFNDDNSLQSRALIVNLRCEAEMLIFIGQTGMNFSQAHQLQLNQFSYYSYLDGYHVRARKDRRGGDVLFEIFKEYKHHFERYLDWRRRLFPGSILLFPFVRSVSYSKLRPTQFHRTRDACRMVGLDFVGPRKLRGVRVNWMLRESGNPDLTAEVAQHSKETLFRYYDRPSQQRAIGEIMRFWSQQDAGTVRAKPVAPGECDGVPLSSTSIPAGVAPPDCIRASGCLWCDHHRDIDSQDYIWALVSFRHLKCIELSKAPPKQSERAEHPVNLAIDRIVAKLRWFHESNSVRRSWLEEAEARVEEGNYHPSWKWLIDSA